VTTIPPEGYVEDDAIWPLMVQMHQCLCETLTERGLMPGACFCGILPGDQAVWDYSDGMAWVRLVDSYPSTAFPAANTTPRVSCSAMLVATLEVGLLQCAPQMGGDGSLPTQEAQMEASRLQIAGMRALQQAIACCDLPLIVLGTYTPQGPQGGLVGGFWQINVGAE
jgi:hypothetical protein